VVAEVRKRLSASKRARRKFDKKRFNLKKLSNRFTALENFKDGVDINRDW
jgi:hypothetical protein